MPAATGSQGHERGPVPPPSLYLRMLEGLAPLAVKTSLALWPLLGAGPRGNGHSVLVLPGFLASDHSTEMLRSYFRQRGFAALGWGQGNNLGQGPGVIDACLKLLRQLQQRSARRVSLVGQSQGSIAMHAAARHAVADRLTGLEGQWAPFQRHGIRQWIYSDTQRRR